jgi:hypothetical protein
MVCKCGTHKERGKEEKKEKVENSNDAHQQFLQNK